MESREESSWVNFLEDPWSQKMKKILTIHVTKTFWNRFLLENYSEEALGCLISKVAQKKNTGTEVLMS